MLLVTLSGAIRSYRWRELGFLGLTTAQGPAGRQSSHYPGMSEDGHQACLSPGSVPKLTFLCPQVGTTVPTNLGRAPPPRLAEAHRTDHQAQVPSPGAASRRGGGCPRGPSRARELPPYGQVFFSSSSKGPRWAPGQRPGRGLRPARPCARQRPRPQGRLCRPRGEPVTGLWS